MAIGAKSLRCAFVGCPHDDQQKHHGHDDFGHQGRQQAVASGRVFSVPIGGKPRRDIKASLAAGDDVQHAAGCDPAQNLGDNVRDQILCREAATRPKPKRNGRVQMATGYMSDRECHGEHRQAEGKRNAQ